MNDLAAELYSKCAVEYVDELEQARRIGDAKQVAVWMAHLQRLAEASIDVATTFSAERERRRLAANQAYEDSLKGPVEYASRG